MRLTSTQQITPGIPPSLAQSMTCPVWDRRGNAAKTRTRPICTGFVTERQNPLSLSAHCNSWGCRPIHFLSPTTDACSCGLCA